MLTSSIVNKILHLPTVKMKEAAGSNECYLYVDAVRTLFDLSGNGAQAGGGAESPAAEPAAVPEAASGADRTMEPAVPEAAVPAPRDAPDVAVAVATVHQLRGAGTGRL